MRLLISEILERIEAASSRAEKIALLKMYESPCLRGLMRINFDKTVSMDLPPGIPEKFKKIDDKPIGIDHSMLELEYKKFYIWLNKSLNLTRHKKEALFLDLLESLHYKEAEVLCLIKDQTLQYRFPSITEDLIRETWEYLMPPKEKPLVEKQEDEGIIEKIKKSSNYKGRKKGSKNKPKD